MMSPGLRSECEYRSQLAGIEVNNAAAANIVSTDEHGVQAASDPNHHEKDDTSR
jgi:hypothetical protein